MRNKTLLVLGIATLAFNVCLADDRYPDPEDMLRAALEKRHAAACVKLTSTVPPHHRETFIVPGERIPFSVLRVDTFDLDTESMLNGSPDLSLIITNDSITESFSAQSLAISYPNPSPYLPYRIVESVDIFDPSFAHYSAEPFDHGGRRLVEITAQLTTSGKRAFQEQGLIPSLLENGIAGTIDGYQADSVATILRYLIDPETLHVYATSVQYENDPPSPPPYHIPESVEYLDSVDIHALKRPAEGATVETFASYADASRSIADARFHQRKQSL